MKTKKKEEREGGENRRDENRREQKRTEEKGKEKEETPGAGDLGNQAASWLCRRMWSNGEGLSVA